MTYDVKSLPVISAVISVAYLTKLYNDLHVASSIHIHYDVETLPVNFGVIYLAYVTEYYRFLCMDTCQL